MKKLDEIMELMTDEMDEFKKGLLQLQKLSNELHNRSIPITTEVLEKQLNFFFQKQEKREALTAEAFKTIDQKLKKAYLLPKSLGILFGSLLILLVTLIGYLTFLVVESEKGEDSSYSITKGESGIFNNYLEEKPKIKADYEKWLHNQNSP
ncbi:hypothetical protein SAMN04488034_101848 [Salinimicrobium catena]|uniref:Uncharacterized protein n=1 Tax=Salinimicrobium catena TaxID=390640 RepID=A0A1H5JSX3_9FLAO|nr:DUF6730 family protein [Salinimicrobium catena]SDK90166.1 hypothetical protein SAMN04488140_101834 [Salinimicrobium catena]SEE55703.1 hypothetical protein SAMN04488034_101848 [Salinimicrobium catena]